jgi:hypothetical protein
MSTAVQHTTKSAAAAPVPQAPPAATIADRCVARRPLFKDARYSDADVDRMVDEEDADYAALAAIPGARDEKARAFRASLFWQLHRECRCAEMTYGEHALLVALIEG